MVRLLVLIIAFGFATNAMAADCGQFKIVKGKVTYKKKSKKKFKKARINKKICQGDLVKTAKDSRAKIIMADKNEINVSPDTELLIEVYQKGKKAVLNVLNGKVRSNVKSKYKDNNNSHYRVKTKSAVAGVRGTEFLASYNNRTNQSRVVTFEGEVMVGKIGPGGQISAKVSVKPGQFTSNKPGENPHPAKEVPPAEFAQIDADSNVSDSGGGKAPASAAPQQNNNKEEPEADKGDKGAAQPDSNDKGNKPEPAAGNDKGGADKPAGSKGGDGQASNGGGGKPPAGAPGLDAPEFDEPSGGKDGSNRGGRGIASVDANSSPKIDPAGAGPGREVEIDLPPPDLALVPVENGDIKLPNRGPDLTQIIRDTNNLDNIQRNPATENNIINTNSRTRVTIIPIAPGAGGN